MTYRTQQMFIGAQMGGANAAPVGVSASGSTAVTRSGVRMSEGSCARVGGRRIKKMSMLEPAKANIERNVGPSSRLKR